MTLKIGVKDTYIVVAALKFFECFLNINFAEKSIKSGNIRANNMFKEKEKLHTMNLREEENIKVDFANAKTIKH